jgi:hypothetical protein
VCQIAIISSKGNSMRNNLGDHTFNPQRAANFGLGVASTLAASVGAGLLNMLDRRRRPTRYVSAKAMRMSGEQRDAALFALGDLLLKHAHHERDAALTRADEAEAELQRERLSRANRSRK